MATTAGPSTKKRKIDSVDVGSLTGEDAKQAMEELISPLATDAGKLIEALIEHAGKYPGLVSDLKTSLWSDPALCKIFVRELSFSTTDDTLTREFSQFGEIEEAVVIVHKDSGKSKGYGFVVFKSGDSAQRCLAKPEKIIDGRTVKCNLAIEGNPNRGSGGGGGARTPAYGAYQHYGAAPRVDPQANAATRIFVRSLAWDATEDDLRRTFSMYGTLTDVAVIRERGSGKSKGYGFVTYSSPVEAQAALAQSDKEICGRTAYCNLAIEGQNRIGATPQPQRVQAFAAPPQYTPQMFAAPMQVPQYATPQYGAMPMYAGQQMAGQVAQAPQMPQQNFQQQRPQIGAQGPPPGRGGNQGQMGAPHGAVQW